MTAGARSAAGSFGAAVLVHIGLLGVVMLGLWQWRRPPPPPQRLAIEATVVMAGTAAPVAPPTVEPVSEPVNPVPAPVEPLPPPTPDPQLQREAREREARELEAKERQARETKAREAKAREQAAAERTAREKLVAETVAREKAERERKAREQREREQAVREQQQREQQQREARQREAELSDRLAAEERQQAVRSSGLLAQYQAMIRDRIERAWIRPASARPGLSCELRISQVPGGEVVRVGLGACNGDEAVRQSIEAAAYRASPLPQPPDPSLFERNLIVTFRPEQ